MPTKVINNGMDPEMMKAVEAAGKILTAFFMAVTEVEHIHHATAKMIAKSDDGYFEITIRQVKKSEVVDVISGSDIGSIDRDVIFENLDIDTENAVKAVKKEKTDTSGRFS